MRALNRKLLRDVKRLSGQVLTIALVLASGITSFIALRGTYASLEQAKAAYYDRYRFAHVFASLERAPNSLLQKLETLPGVALIETRISEQISLPIEGMARPAYGRVLSLPKSGSGALNALYLREGRLPEPESDDEVVVIESFAQAHALRLGSRVPAVLSGKRRSLRVVGIALSPEFVYAIRPGAIVNDPQHYAVLWMTRWALSRAFRLDGAFNDLSLRLQPGAPEAKTLAALDRALTPYGGDGAILRKDQVSDRMLTVELGQLASLANMVPLVFLAVSIFLINLVLSRLITLQRPEIATLKAVGYDNGQLRLHYLGLVSVVLIPGGLFGLLGGWQLGRFLIVLYGGVFGFPELSFQLTPALLIASLLVSAIATWGAALLSVRAATRLSPAEAMRPPAPAHYRQSLLEKLGLAAIVGPSGLMIVREVQRRPLRTLLSSLGIAGAIALLILGRFGLDSLDSYLEGTLRREQRQDLTVTFTHSIAPRAIAELAHQPGVLAAEGLRSVPVRVSRENRGRDSVLIGLPEASTLRGLIQRDGRALHVAHDGVILSLELGRILGLHAGDRLDIATREGARRTVHPVVAGFLDDSVGLSIYAERGFVAALQRDQDAVSSLLLAVDPRARSSVEAKLRNCPEVLDVSDLHSDMQRLRNMNASMMDIWTLVSITLATSVILGVVYNNARISLAARSRDLASLRVLGFSRAEISRVLIGGLALEVALALPIGLWLGRTWGGLFMSGVDQETFRWSVVVAPRTYGMAASVALLAASASALWVRRSLDRLDLIAVLKTRE